MSCGNVPDGQADSEEGQALMTRHRAVRRADKTTCSRCRTSRSLFIVRATAFCHPCLSRNTLVRFIKQLYPPLRPIPAVTPKANKARSDKYGFSRPPRQAGDVAVAVSGGAGSMAMLDMLLQHGYVGKGDGKTADLTKGEREVLWDRGTVVYVEFAGVTGMEDRMGAMKTLAEEKGLRFVGLRAEEAFDSTLGQKLGRPSASPGGIAVDLSNPSLPLLDLPSASSPASASAPDPLLRLQTLLASLPAPSRPALLAHILSHLLNLAAYSIPNVSHLLLGETSTREAQRVVSGTALGRGWALPLELASATPLLAPNTDSASDPPPTTLDVSAPINPAPAPIPAAPQSITRLKPMKDVTLKEAALYCHLRGIPTVNHRKWTSEAGGGSDARGKGVHTIESLTEAFIAGLDVTHPATVSTINKTGDKLVFNGDSPSLPGPENCCPVCQTPAEPSAQAWKSRTALTSLPGRTKSIESAVPDSTDDHSGSVELAPMLCYSCLTTFTPSSTRKGTDKGQPAYLPQWVAESVRKREVPREEMRAGISGFLLDGE